LRVLDLGAGTGKLTASLVDLGHEVVAVDPSPQMLDELRTAVPGVAATHVGSAEALPLEDGAVDAITVAQAWHWFDAPAAAAECARVLRPGGVLGIAWHVRDETVPWVAQLAEQVGRSGDSSSTRRGAPVELGAAFGPVEEQLFDYQLVTTAQGLRDLADTWSYVYLAPDRQQRLDAVLALARSAAEPDGRLVVPHVTRCFRAVVL
jgi:ubiquinone/menaquinone biosynthesis C-methylase UbiE